MGGFWKKLVENAKKCEKNKIKKLKKKFFLIDKSFFKCEKNRKKIIKKSV